jgi:isoleucyl-tRNA synthetase
MSDFNSIHLQDFPDVSKIVFDRDLVSQMDLVQDICSVALFLRDKHNLRVRLPLNSIRIIGEGVAELKKYNEIIAEEINVKNVFFEENLFDYATFILEVDLKKLGAKYGEKLQTIIKGVKGNNWEIVDDKAKVGDILLEKDEYVLKIKSKNEKANNIEPLSNNKMLIELDFTITKELELEGIARDLVRNIQQTRKEKNFDVSDRINLFLKTNDPQILEAVDKNSIYIKEQTLTIDLKIEDGNEKLLIEIQKV